MVIMNILSNTNIYQRVFNKARIGYEKTQMLTEFFFQLWNSKQKFRSKFSRSNSLLLLCILFLLICLLFTQQFNSQTTILTNSSPETADIHLFLKRIRDIVILDRNHVFNINYSMRFDGIPKWLNQYGITHFFNFYWLQNGAYLWHLQRMFDLKHASTNLTKYFHQTFFEHSDQTTIFDYLNGHPEYGLILDTAFDPIQSLFTSLPRTSSTFEKTCASFNNWNPCKTMPDIRTSLAFKPLITYALYDTTIEMSNSTNGKMNHYDEVIFLFDSKRQLTNETSFVRQILPRLIRLLALVSESSMILLPLVNTQGYVSQYIDVLIERGLINDKKRFIEYRSNETYHSNAIYSTSSPRSDIILLNRILLGDKPPVRRELILILRQNLDDDSYGQIVQTINLFELPDDLSYLHVQDYNEPTDDLKEIGPLFQQARIVIGMPTHQLSHIVWCQPHTDIIEIIQPTMTTDYYEISLQLQLNYWLVMATKTNRIDIIDFRNLMMKILTDTDA